ncbi:MAG: peptidoglycan DD-metalloendopeptidase family protein [Clostridia bacterium]|nr:peptidoglycan DD-metalloendopeptidase family protein [Clostridia bacterium]
MQKKKWISLALALIMIVSCSFMTVRSDSAYAASVQDRINQATKDKQAALNELNKDKKAKSQYIAQKEKIDHEIDLIEAELSEIDAIIGEAEAGIKQKEEEIAGYEAQIAENDENFRRRFRAMDESVGANYLDILLNSTSMSDFFLRLETLREFTEYDQSVIDEMLTLKQGIEASKNELVLKRDEQKQARDLVDNKRDSLNAKLKEQNQLITKISAEIEKDEKLFNEASRLEEQLKESLRSSLSSSNSSKNSTTPSGKTLKYSGGKFAFPAPSMTRVSSQYGYRTHPVTGQKYKFHKGMDLAAPQGTNIVAAEAGVVRSAGWNGGYGYCVVIDHGSGVATLYGHSSKLLVKKGQEVSKGQVIAKVGSTGVSTGPHLHFEVLINGNTTNPAPYIGLG